MYGLKPVPFKLKPVPFKPKPAPFMLKCVTFKLTHYFVDQCDQFAGKDE